VLNGDAVLSFLGIAGHGGWSTFERAIQDVTGSELPGYYAARAFSSQALVEFDWLGDRAWSVPPLSIVRIDRCRFLSVVIMNDEIESELRANGVLIETTTATLTNTLKYSRHELIGPDDGNLEPFERLGPRLRLEPTALNAGANLLAALPQIGSIIDSRPVVSLQAAVRDGEAHFLDNDALTFAHSSARPNTSLPFEMIRVRHPFCPPEYYYVDSRGARRIELELALAYAAGRSGITFIYHAGNTLAIWNSVPLPVLVSRALHLGGAQFTGVRRAASDGRSYAWFTGVSTPIARTVAMKLLTTVKTLPAGDL
jgi:hypothetical protein